jgi:hypothetical protein
MLRAWAKGDGVASLTRALLALVVSLCAGAAGSQTLPFVEPGGLMQAELRYSQVVARLGEPSRSREKWMSGDPALEGGIVFEYPAQGLGFVVPADERPRPDPRVAYVLVRAPAAARTPEGIGIGMPLAAVRPLISAGDARPEGGMLAWSGSPGAGRRRAQLQFGSARTLELMVFDAGLARAGVMADWIKKVRVALAGVLLLATLLAMPWLLKNAPENARWRLRARAPMRRALGRGMWVTAPVLVLLGGVVTAAGDGSVWLLGVLLLVGGAGLVLTGAYNRTLAAGLKLRWLVVALLPFLAVLAALNALLG